MFLQPSKKKKKEKQLQFVLLLVEAASSFLSISHFQLLCTEIVYAKYFLVS